MKPMKPYKHMKPARAWTVVDERGIPLQSMFGWPALYRTKRDAQDFELYDDNDRRCSKATRVRILDNAAVERAIAALRRARTDTVYQSEVESAIRDLGGRP